MSGARKLVVALAGAAGSGKSTVGRMLADRLHGELASFGDFVRHLASELGESHDRETLQRIGQSRIDDDAQRFINQFLSWAAPADDSPMVIDGVRHVAVDQILREWCIAQKQNYFLILINASEGERARRRHGGNEQEVQRIDKHRVERETADALPQVADFVIDGDGTPDTVIGRIVASAPVDIADRVR